MARLRLLGPAGKRYATARDPKNLARAVISAREYAAATAATNPVPRRLPHSMPLRLQPFLRRAPPVPILGQDHVLHPYNLYTPSSEPRPPSRIDTLLLPTRCTRHPRLPPPPQSGLRLLLTTMVQALSSSFTVLIILRPTTSVFSSNTMVQTLSPRPPRSSPCAQPHLLLVLLFLPCSPSQTTEHGAPAVLTERHPKRPRLCYNTRWVHGHDNPTQQRLPSRMSASVDTPSAVTYLFDLFL